MKRANDEGGMTDVELPIGWAQSKIGNLCSLKNGRAFKPTEWTTAGLPIVRIQNLNNPKSTFNYFAGEPEPRYHLLGGELLFAWSGTPGTSFGAHVWRGGEAVLNQHIFRVDFDAENMDKRFFRNAINQKLDELIGVAHGGVGLRHVTKGTFESTEIKVPPLPEQKRIADKLEAVLGRVDACRARLDRVPALLKRFRQSVLAAATTGKLTEEWRNSRKIKDASQCFQIGEDALDVPKSWETGVLRDLLDPSRPLCYGVVQPGEESAGGSLLIRVQDLENGSVNVDDLRTISKRVDLEYKRSRILEGDLLISVVGTIGRTAIVPPNLEANIARAIARLACRKGVESRWLNYWLSCDTLQWWLSSSSKEVARKTLNLSEVGNTPVALPPSDEQKEIVRRVEDLFAFADRIEARIATAQKTVERLTPATLAKAFRGELLPQDPNDEPASALLKRLGSEKAPASGKSTRGKRTKVGTPK